jgi:hypothetical protein
MQHARHSAEALVLALVEPAQTVKVTEQLVRSVDEMHHHYQR